jgi:tetratricopeptide (TPR) repeat protein
VACYRRALSLRPDFAEAHNNLGNALKAQNQLDEAVAAFSEAIRCRAAYVESHYNLGKTYQAQGKFIEAAASFHAALHCQPHHAEVLNDIGVAFQEQDNHEEAKNCFQKALELNQTLPAAWNNLGTSLLSQQNGVEAGRCFEEALRLKPDYVAALVNLGNAHRDQSRPAEALDQFRRALCLQPGNAEIHNNQGVVLKESGRWDEALTAFHEAIRLQPDHAVAHHNLGSVFLELGQLAKAAECYHQALRIRPKMGEAHLGLGDVRRQQGRLAEAETCFLEAIRLLKEPAEGRTNLGILRLFQGKFAEGWPEYEWRRQMKSMISRSYARPLWKGEPLHGQTILLHAEQGLGDTLQFVRYAPMVKAKAGRVVLECQPGLVEILKCCHGIDRLVPAGAALPEFAVQIPLLSLPGLFGTTLETIPASVPYLRAAKARIAPWRERLSAPTGMKVGICWQGNPQHKNDRRRSVPLKTFAPLANVPYVRLVSLQRGQGQEQLDDPGQSLPVMRLMPGEENPAQAWIETTSLVASLDLVITIDTAVAHLAGAMGVPVWVALPFAPDWRWLQDREDCPWYPSMKLFRQRQPGDWKEVFQRLALELQLRVQ